MKKTLWLAAAGLLFLTSCIIYIPYEGPFDRPSEREYRLYEREYGLSDFYDTLERYGAWVNVNPYGYVWIPRGMSYGWRPYTYGRWVWTEYGWTWVSIFEWGWIPFHYGRWDWNARLGWFWIPDNVWGPAWVTWRWNSLYIGWAPLPPRARYIAGTGLEPFSYEFPLPSWIFVEGRFFLDLSLNRYILPFERNSSIIKYTVQKTNIVHRGQKVVNDGLSLEQVKRVVSQDIPLFGVQDASRPGPSRVEFKELEIFRPPVKGDPAAKPRRSLSQEEAEVKIQQNVLETDKGEISPDLQEYRLKREQQQEFQILKSSQSRQLTVVKSRYEKERQASRSTDERKVIEQEQKQELEALQKRHETERKEIVNRHEKEREAVKKLIKKKKDD